jgi:hypothetical protein
MRGSLQRSLGVERAPRSWFDTVHPICQNSPTYGAHDGPAQRARASEAREKPRA